MENKKEPYTVKALIELCISLFCTWSLLAISYGLSRYFEDMGGAVLFISGLLIGKYLQEKDFKI